MHSKNNNNYKINKIKEKMKKIAFLFMAMMTMTFASCNSKNGETPANGTDSLAGAGADTTVVVADSLVETAADTVVVAE